MFDQNNRGRPRIGASLATAFLLSSGGALAQGAVIEPPPEGPEDVPRPSDSVREILALPKTECLARLRSEGVSFEGAEGPGEDAAYLRLAGPIDGVRIEFAGRDAVHDVIDCRLALVLREWAPELRRARVSRLGHLSIYRPNSRVRGSGHESGHAHALAIDLRFVELDDGRVLDVERDFGDATRGAAPCDPALVDAEDASPIRRLVCDAVAQGRFQIVVTPHRDDAHANHVHLEVVPEVDWVYVR